MRYRELPGTGERAAVVCLGTAPYGTGTPAELAFELMDEYVAAGGNFFDTAHVYGAWAQDGEGASEKVIGEWLGRTGMRDQLLIASKGAHPDMDTGESRMSRKWLHTHLLQSLDRLKIEHLDFYWLHRDDTSVPVADILAWMNELVDEGRIRAFGFSNWTLEREKEASQCAAEKGLTPFAATQLSWSLAQPAQGSAGRSGMHAVDPARRAYYAQTGFPVMAYSSQAGGFFGPKYDPDAPEEEKRAGVLKKYATEGNMRRRAAARQIAARIDADANQVAVAWLLHQPMPVFAIVGPHSVAQVRDSCAAGDISLTPGQVSALTEQG